MSPSSTTTKWKRYSPFKKTSKKVWLISLPAGTTSLNNFKIAETETFQEKMQSSQYKFLYKKIKEYIYPLLRENPYFGPNIKKLKGKYKEVYRFRVGDYRLFYTISEKKVLVFILNIEKIKNAYA